MIKVGSKVVYINDTFKPETKDPFKAALYTKMWLLRNRPKVNAILTIREVIEKERNKVSVLFEEITNPTNLELLKATVANYSPDVNIHPEWYQEAGFNIERVAELADNLDEAIEELISNELVER